MALVDYLCPNPACDTERFEAEETLEATDAASPAPAKAPGCPECNTPGKPLKRPSA